MFIYRNRKCVHEGCCSRRSNEETEGKVRPEDQAAGWRCHWLMPECSNQHEAWPPCSTFRRPDFISRELASISCSRASKQHPIELSICTFGDAPLSPWLSNLWLQWQPKERIVSVHVLVQKRTALYALNLIGLFPQVLVGDFVNSAYIDFWFWRIVPTYQLRS